MFLSLNWLKTYVNLPKGLTVKQLAHDLTMSTVEVEGVENQAEKFENIVIGKIVEIKAHPNADKLKIVMLDIGKKDLVRVVCGGTNLTVNMLVAVALPGAKVRWHGEGNLVELQATEIRGEKSFGMICSANEIGLEKILPCGEKEIVDLSGFYPLLTKEGRLDGVGRGGLKPGQNLAEALGLDDTIVELDNKSITHRSDLWNHYGVARELAVIYKTNLKPLVLSQAKQNNNKKIKISIEDKKSCDRYMGCVIKNIKIAPSPDWLVKSLEAVGLRSINNIVDITNYVMLDVGEPMHAFDMTKLNQPQIIIRKAQKNEKILALDGVERKLDESMLVIADNKNPIAIAGVMGGSESAVDEKTTTIILEAAHFDAVTVRRATQKLDLRTDASNRFEKSLDPCLVETGMQRALTLIKAVIPNTEVESLVDVNYVKKEKITITAEHAYLEKKIGQKFESQEIVKILERLGFVVSKKTKSKEIVYTLEVPTWRSNGDIKYPEDIVEEVARIYGYDNLPAQTQTIAMHKAVWQPAKELERQIKVFLANNAGMQEVFCYPWADTKTLNALGFYGKIRKTESAGAGDSSCLETSLIPNLLKATEDNLRYFSEFKIFEVAKIFPASGSEKKMLACAIATEKNKDAFLIIKGILESLLKDLRIKIYDLKNGETPTYISKEKKLNIFLKDKNSGWLGMLEKNIYQKFNFKNREICLVEIDLEELIVSALVAPEKKYAVLPQFPSVQRDLSFELEWSTKWENIKDEILRLAPSAQDKLIQTIEFLSEFDAGEKKSIALRTVYQANRTLKDEEVEVIQNKIIKLMQEKFNGKLRV